MRISFDLDDTLICYRPTARHEPRRVPWWLRWRRHEPLRLEAVTLLSDLTAAGHELWVYTTSWRSPRGVARWLAGYGVRVHTVVNQTRHERQFGTRGPSKHPGRFGIDLHIDDSSGVWVEGRLHGFRVLVVLPDDPDWTVKVWDAVERLGTGKPIPAPADLPDVYAHLAE